MENYKVTVILLTWKRISRLPLTLKTLKRQTYKNFNVRISNANDEEKHLVEQVVKNYGANLKIEISHDSNDKFAFRRLEVARDVAEKGTDIVLYIDDDIDIPSDYIERAVKQFIPNTYQSAYTWSFYNNGSNYYKYRTRVTDRDTKVHYCGTGVGMVDAKIFLEDGLFHAPPAAILTEDLWLSYYANHVMGWELKYMHIPDIVINGGDSVALYRQVARHKYNKRIFLLQLVRKGWNLTA